MVATTRNEASGGAKGLKRKWEVLYLSTLCHHQSQSQSQSQSQKQGNTIDQRSTIL
jgi:hypothetical protein